MMYKRVTAASRIVKCNICGRVITGRSTSHSNYRTLGIFCYICIIINIAVDHKQSVRRKKRSISAERVAYIIDILEEIEVVLLHVQYDTDCWAEREKTVGVFTCFCNKIGRMPYPQITSDGMKHTADRYGRIEPGRKKYLGKHGSRCRLAVCSGNSDSYLIVKHNLAEKFGSCKNGNTLCGNCRKFRVIRVDCRGINRYIYIICNIVSSLAYMYRNTLAYKAVCQLGLFHIRT